MTRAPRNVIPAIFRSYDIRGLAPEEFDTETAEKIGRAFAQLTRAKKVVLGRDARITSQELHQAIMKGLLDQGVDVDDLGLIPSEAMYFAVGRYGYDGGLMVTASHNPKEYNGLRMVDRDVKMIPGKHLYELVEKDNYAVVLKKGKRGQHKVLEEYIDYVLSFADLSVMKPLTVVVDAGNGMAGVTIPKVFERLPFQLHAMYLELDGNFPNRPSNPLLPESQKKIRQRIAETRADFGVLFDGDADRVLLMTEKGELVRGDIALLLMAKNWLRREPGAGIAYNLISSKIVPEKIVEWGGRPLRSPVGFINLSATVRGNNGAFSGETSAHYSFRDNYYADSALIALMLLLNIISSSKRPLSELVRELNPYFRKERYVELDGISEILAVMQEAYAANYVDDLDGLTFDFGEWWFNARPSNTEPLLRLTFEAKNENLLNDKIQEITQWLQSRSETLIIKETI
ncbi:MAG: phosphomannomutase/phosphoglucomutase [bacterium]|nr:phosphomannomutase/phosphoglucomutase [bacterium]